MRPSRGRADFARAYKLRAAAALESQGCGGCDPDLSRPARQAPDELHGEALDHALRGGEQWRRSRACSSSARHRSSHRARGVLEAWAELENGSATPQQEALLERLRQDRPRSLALCVASRESR